MLKLLKLSRRTLIQGAAATTAILSAPITLRAQAAPVRKSLATSDSDADVSTYREAVKYMLTQADPNDPSMFHLNWYRNAMIHLLDCPHGNWWFAVWHRPYLGYLEQKIRVITGNEEFALPFWDWSDTKEIPAAFMSDPTSSDPDIQDNPLDPSSSYYANAPANQPLRDAHDLARLNAVNARDALVAAQASGDATSIAQAQADFDAKVQVFLNAQDSLQDHTFSAFDAAYRPAFEALWKTFTPNQLAHLTTRFGAAPGQTSVDFDWFWLRSQQGPWSVRDNFQWDAGNARFLTLPDAKFTDKGLIDAVARSNIDSSVRSANFALHSVGEGAGIAFNSIETDNQSVGSATQAILEGQPHNLVHNATGAVMQSNLSSVDPIFFAHHANVDRIWDVWTRRQQSLTPPGPFLPEQNAAKFNAEEFLFYIVPDGMPVDKDITAETFMDKDRFGYSYATGIGEDQIETPLVFATVATPKAGIGDIPKSLANQNIAPFATVSLADELSVAFNKSTPAPNVLAEITATLPSSLVGLNIDVFVAPKGDGVDMASDSAILAGAIGFFGMSGLGHGGLSGEHSHMAGDSVFNVDITGAIQSLNASGALPTGGEVEVSVKAERSFGKAKSDASGQVVLKSVRLKTI